MGVNIVKYGNQTLIDLTDTTAVASDVAQGKYFYGKDGVKTLGTATGGGATYSVTNNLSHVENDNTSDTVAQGGSYVAKLSSSDGNEISSVTVTMGNVDITASVYSSFYRRITIKTVTGDLVITATGTEIPVTIINAELGTLGISTGDEQASTTRIRTDYISVTNGDTIGIGGENWQVTYRWYDSSKTYKGNAGGWKSRYTLSHTGIAYVRLIFRKSNDSTLNGTELDGKTILFSNSYMFINQKGNMHIEDVYMYYGKGTSGANIIDNDMRCLSDVMDIAGLTTPLVTNFMCDTQYTRYLFRFVSNYSSSGIITMTQAYNPVNPFGASSNRVTLLSTTSNGDTSISIPNNAVGFRIALAIAESASSTVYRVPLPVPKGVFCINDKKFNIIPNYENDMTFNAVLQMAQVGGVLADL